MAEETTEVVTVERLVLNKFDGDLTDEEMASGEHEPVETIVLNGEGQVIEHYVKEDTNGTN